ncbi:M1 family metallopeptidase [Paraflavitalea sp. CAU 1676]|uniref:M1 family metallopeptidase n=1 Tax=Paraflavitalea sp. CAU 1676 TaxID=3032598 RepID=UPI0023DB609C|nr:M1 family metallopeptidase [Paraflavitalea sp. CAU 1676]MDF2193739.1 M1 family metallopeptidase [Paraflavitalea sp. CAU 1676]
MKKLLFGLLSFLTVQNLWAQPHEAEQDTTWKKLYRESAPMINDLVHTKIDARFDYANSYLNGKAWITLKPHFYATDSLALDAKGMEIKKVTIVKGATTSPLKYDYNGWVLNIQLDKSYKGGEKYTVYIEYTSKPNELKVQGSAAITDAKGLYFVNPKGEEKDKPTQIWTQGETEATSVWVPTIDKPNQKTTQETIMTVPDKYVTLSNGKLVSSKKNADGTRTDSWNMDLPHAPYLFFMGVGEYAVIKDSYKGKEVSYYVEKEYGPVAKRIFGHTPEMMAFFSKITGVDYPWAKYAQIVGRDYVSGAMENTTATLHQESAQQDARELVDGNGWESTIAHELFHHWFGDYVTSESWSNLTLNESFANYSETLWDEYKYGKDAGDAQNYTDMNGYLQSGSDKKDLVRFYYTDKEAMFDAVSYNKGGRILHMLRNFVGDSAFFKAINLYLTSNKFKAAEAHHLRLAFEEVTGKDLNWFWNQWYYGSGHPKLAIDYVYDEEGKKVSVIVKQTQAGDKTFKLPIAIDIYNGANKVRHQVWIDAKVDTFTFSYSSKPDLVNVDGDKTLLAEKKDNKSLSNYVHQYKYAGLYMDRREALDFAGQNQTDPRAIALLKDGLQDKYYGLRGFALNKINMKNQGNKKEFEPLIAAMAKNDPRPVVRATALMTLGNYEGTTYKDLFVKNVSDSSYTVAGMALEALAKVDSVAAFNEAKRLSGQPSKGALVAAVMKTMIKGGDEASFPQIAKSIGDMPLSQAKFNMLPSFSDYLAKVNSTESVKKGVDILVDFREQTKQFGLEPVINGWLKGIVTKKEAAKAIATDKTALQAQIDYIKTKLGDEKAGF